MFDYFTGIEFSGKFIKSIVCFRVPSRIYTVIQRTLLKKNEIA